MALRKALGSVKDTTTINLAKEDSDYKELNVAIVKATNHVEHPAKENHFKAIFATVSAVRPGAHIAYNCIRALARRLSRTPIWDRDGGVGEPKKFGVKTSRFLLLSFIDLS
ncbi:putative clathrin assembly protein [Drosera capensis]